MPKIITPLNDKKIQNLKPKEKDYIVADGEGLYLIITTLNKKIWRFIYNSIIDKKRRKINIGNYPSLSLSEARQKVQEFNKQLAKNVDPVENNKNENKRNKHDENGLFENVLNEYFKRQKKILAEITYNRKYALFRDFVLPRFKDKHIKDITKKELLKLLEDKEKTAKETASRLFNYLSNLWAFAVLKDYCEYNYLANINKNDVLVEKRIRKNYPKITDDETFKELVNKIYGYNSEGSIKNSLKLILHIPLRAYNLCNLKWDYINFDNKVLTIPRELMKVKNHNLQDFRLPLTDEVIKILEEQKELCTKFTGLKEYIFIGVKNFKPINAESPNQALTRMGFTAEKKQSLHSFRGSFRTICEEKYEEHKIDNRIIESVLDHFKESKVELSYKNKINYLERQKPLVEWWSKFVLKMLQYY